MWDPSKCDLCGDCLVKCLYFDYGKNDAMTEIKNLMDGKEASILSKCITCFGCVEHCPTGADPFDLILKMQIKWETSPIKKYWLAPSDFLKRVDIPSELIAGDPEKPVLVLGTVYPSIPEGALDGQLFQGMTIAKGGKYYSLFGITHWAALSYIEKHIPTLIDEISVLGKEVVFLHDDAYTMVHVKARDYGVTVPFEYMSLFEYLRNYLRDHKSSITKLGKKVAYQRNCASRYTPEKDAFLDEIFDLIGVERVQRKYDRENAICCGAPMFDSLSKFSDEIQKRNIKDAIAFGAEALVQYCPACYRTLKKITAKLGLKQIFITDLCRIALNERPWPV